MSQNEHATTPDDVEPGDRPKPSAGADRTSSENREETTLHPADQDAIPGEDPEDNPDKEGEDRFDAG